MTDLRTLRRVENLTDCVRWTLSTRSQTDDDDALARVWPRLDGRHRDATRTHRTIKHVGEMELAENRPEIYGPARQAIYLTASRNRPLTTALGPPSWAIVMRTQPRTAQVRWHPSLSFAIGKQVELPVTFQ
jgi:hypothetical protein